MKKQDIIWKLRDARKSHKRWVSYALALIQGIPVEKDQVPVIATDCAFGQWYYGMAQSLKNLPSFQAIEEPHTELHDIYIEIFNLLFNQKKTGFFSKLVGKSARIDEQNRKLAKEKYKQLDKVSRTIVQQLEALEKEVQAMDDEKLEALI